MYAPAAEAPPAAGIGRPALPVTLIMEDNRKCNTISVSLLS